MNETDTSPAELLAALVKGDCWLSADQCAAYLGLFERKTGRPNRRAFLERVAVLPSFPRALTMSGSTRAWKKSEVEDWAITHRRHQAA